jgi:hypothetical protein
MDTPKPVTLNSGDLNELNDRIANETLANAVPFSLLQLGQVESSRERQRIKNIKVEMATCHKLGTKFPDQVIFKFTHLGKSVVRAGGRLYAFEPEGAKGPTGATFARVTFETDGGRQGPGWAVDPMDPEKAVLSNSKKKIALWQPTVAAQANLLTKLLNSETLITLSEFRPGIFSDFLLSVEFQPSESKVKFTELVLSVEMEMGNAPIGEVLVSIRNNLGLAISVEASQKDKSGRSGGMGTYTGIYDSNSLSANPVRLTVPDKFGEFVHTGWLLDGQVIKATNHYQDARKSAHIVATYEKRAT